MNWHQEIPLLIAFVSFGSLIHASAMTFAEEHPSSSSIVDAMNADQSCEEKARLDLAQGCVGKDQACTLNGLACCPGLQCKGRFPNTTCQPPETNATSLLLVQGGCYQQCEYNYGGCTRHCENICYQTTDIGKAAQCHVACLAMCNTSRGMCLGYCGR
jgi:hypothetical protein